MSPLLFVLALLPLLGGAERFSCRGRILGAYYADAKSGCKAFHVCVRVAGGGIRDFRFFCPPGTLFHQEAQTCTDWGDDDALACPTDLYDGQFDLYKIGSGFDTRKLASQNLNADREEESEFGLQRAETGDRRSKPSPSPSAPASDLRAAHSSDFFSGQRERGRDEPQQQSRQSFRRPTTYTPPPAPTTTPYPTQPEKTPQKQFDATKQRKLVRKRPIYYTTSPAPTTYAQSTTTFRENYPEPQQNNFARTRPSTAQPAPSTNVQQQYRDEPRIYFQQQNQNVARTKPTTTVEPANVPQQYKEEYVEVPRVTPKARTFASPTPTPFVQSTPPQQRFTKKQGLTELYNYESQSTLAASDRPFKVQHSFNVAPLNVAPVNDYSRKNVNVSPNGMRSNSAASDYSTASPSTDNYKNFNSIPQQKKNNFAQFSGAKQNYYSSPSTSAPVTTQATRAPQPQRLNTVAYNTNIGFNAQSINYSESDEDDGQYRLPPGEDDGQYRPEQYERELLSGAHSLNIAASGNRLPEDQKPRTKLILSQTSAPRPFRPAPTPSATPNPTTRAPEPVYTTTTFRPQTYSTQKTFDYVQTYTTTVRPKEPERIQVPPGKSQPQGAAVTTQNSPPQQRPAAAASRAPAPPTFAPAPPNRPTTRPPNFSKPVNKKEDASYDYAYYDTDSGFSEYDQIEEFGKTNVRV